MQERVPAPPLPGHHQGAVVAQDTSSSKADTASTPTTAANPTPRPISPRRLGSTS